MSKKETQSRLHFLDAHHRFFFSAALAVAAFFLAPAHELMLRLLIGWDIYALSAVALAAIVLSVCDPFEARRNARLQDSSATALFAFVVTAASVSLLAVALLLRSAKSLPPEKLAEYVAVSITAVLLSWSLVHCLFALRYAHLYYSNARDKGRLHAMGGLDFPGSDKPDYPDFAYFSFVVGMTCQVSDVQVSSSRMRRLVLLHGVIAFFFNTAIIAMFVNIVASLL